MMRVLSIGNLNLDIYVKVRELPQPDEAVEALEHYMDGGGSAANFAVAIRRLGAEASFLGAVGEDEVGARLLAGLTEAGVHVGWVKPVPDAPTGTVVVVLGVDGSKRMMAYRGANLHLSPDDVPPEAVESADHVHVATGRLEIVERAVSLARAMGRSTSLDGGSALARRGLETLRGLVDGVGVMFLNLAEARMLTGLHDPLSAAREVKSRLDVGEVGVTMGDGGALALTSQGHTHVPAFKVDPVDATGAGDVFAAAYVYGFLRRLGQWDRLVLANAAAAIKVTRRGARSSPTLGEVLAFMERHGYRVKF